MRIIFLSTIMTIMLLGCASSIKAQALIDMESGLVFTGYNDARIPGDPGTLFSLKEDMIPETEFFYRIRFNFTIKSRHTLSLLYALLETKY